jgi:hypothetical protein
MVEKQSIFWHDDPKAVKKPSMIVAVRQVSISPETKTKAESDAGKIIDQAIRDQMHGLETSQTVGALFAQFMSEFHSVISECSVEDWDGSGATALNPSTIDAAWRFAQVVPLGIRKPSVGAEPDGCLGRTATMERSPSSAMFRPACSI